MQNGVVTEIRSAGDRAFGGWLVLVARQAGLVAITFGGVVVLGRLLGPADFAVYGYTTIGLTLALAVGDLGLSAAIIRGELSASMLRRALGAQLIAIAVATGAGVLALAMIPMDAETRTVAALIGTALLFAALQTLPTALLERRLDFRAVSQVEVGQRAAFTLVAVVLASLGAHLLAVPVAAVLAGAAAYAAALSLVRWRAKPVFRGALSAMRGFGSQWWQGRVAAQASYASYPVMGGLLFTPAEVGFVILALTITSLSTLLAPLVARATFPPMAAATVHDRAAIFRPVFNAFVIVSLPVLAFTFVYAEQIVSGVFGAEWDGAIEVLRMTCVTCIFGIVVTPSVPLLYLLLDPAYVKRVLVLLAVTQFALIPPLTPVVGILAPPLAGVLSGGLTLLLCDSRLRRTRDLSLIREIWLPLLGAVIAATVGAAILSVSSGPAGLMFAGVGVLAVYWVSVRERAHLLRPRRLLRMLGASLQRQPEAPGASTALRDMT